VDQFAGLFFRQLLVDMLAIQDPVEKVEEKIKEKGEMPVFACMLAVDNPESMTPVVAFLSHHGVAFDWHIEGPNNFTYVTRQRPGIEAATYSTFKFKGEPAIALTPIRDILTALDSGCAKLATDLIVRLIRPDIGPLQKLELTEDPFDEEAEACKDAGCSEGSAEATERHHRDQET
jgi:hypothetical protein